METNVINVVRELIDFIEENHICDIHNISWISDEDCYIESDRSAEMQEIINKVEEVMGED